MKPCEGLGLNIHSLYLWRVAIPIHCVFKSWCLCDPADLAATFEAKVSLQFCSENLSINS